MAIDETIPLINVNQPEAAGRGERSDAAANRARILQTAERLFVEHGVAAVTMADIAEAAGVGKGTLYRRFSHKGELCLALMDSQLKAFQDEQLAQMRQSMAAGVPYLEQLSGFLQNLVTFTGVHMPLLCEVQQHSESLDADEVERPHFWQYMTVYALLREAVSAGEMAAALDLPVLAQALLAPLNASTFRFQIQVLGFTPQRIRDAIHTLVAGLASAPHKE